MITRWWRPLDRLCVAAVLLAGLSTQLRGHNPGANITWNREVSRIVYERCASCHRPGGTAFSLMTYQDARPHAAAIKEAVLTRRMPPWGAVKGFGDFRDDQGLTQEQIELITDWVEGSTPRGNNPNMLPGAAEIRHIVAAHTSCKGCRRQRRRDDRSPDHGRRTAAGKGPRRRFDADRRGAPRREDHAACLVV